MKLNALALGVAFAATIIPAFSADTTVTRVDVKTVSAEPVVVPNLATCTTTTTVGTTPSVFVVNPPAIISGAIFAVVKPDDLLRRQAELNARILLEQSAGTLSASQANALITRLDNIASRECALKASGGMTWKQVEHTYRRFDSVARDLDKNSTDSKHRLAGNFIVL